MTDVGVKDPLWRAIQRELGRRLDPELFERCAVDLLQEAYPGLTPMSGPGDGGADGAIATPDGPWTPLVCTTSRDVIGNLTKNLESHRASGGTGQCVVVATSQSLTRRKRQNLEQRAGEHGFLVKNIHAQDDFVGRLYRNPFWRRELLGLTGKLPALSAYPRQPNWKDYEVLGRDAELDWMRDQDKDYVLVGQPGVGKVALLRVLAKEGLGLFAATDDLDRIADAHRESQPEFIFLPDAHLRPDLLHDLLRLRLDLGASIKIAATTWPSRQQEILYDLAVTTKTIDPLPRAVVAKVVRSTVGTASRRFVAKILDQCTDKSGMEGKCKPGLAVSLAKAAINERSAEQLARGTILLEHLRRTCELSPRDMNIVASLAIGGERGATPANVAAALDVSRSDVDDTLCRVSGTGFLADSPFSGGPVSIVPSALRDALVAKRFFSDAASLDVQRALEVVDDATSATDTLISVLARETAALGRCALHDLIRSRLPRDPRDRAHRDLWLRYAVIGRKEAVLWILAHHENLVEVVARPALDHAPARTLPLLLAQLPSVDMALTDWMTEPRPDVVQRRRKVLEAVQRLSATSDEDANANDADQKVALTPVATAFALQLDDMNLDPVTLNEFDWSIGPLPLPQVEKLFELWPSACRLLRASGPAGIKVAYGIAAGWCRAAAHMTIVNTSEEWRVGVRKYAMTMVTDVVALADERPGIVSRARTLAEVTGLDVELPPVDPKVAAVLPSYRPRKTVGETGPMLSYDNETDARKRAEALAAGDAHSGVDELLCLAKETQLAGHHPGHHRLTTFVETVAERVADPAAWTRRLVSHAAPAQWVAPFLRAAAARGLHSHEVWNLLLEKDKYCDLAISAALQHGDLPGRVQDSVMDRLVRNDQRHTHVHAGDRRQESIMDIWTHHSSPLPAISWKAVHEEWKLRLLRSEHRRLAMAAASAIWHSDDPTGLSQPVQSAWLNVMAECDDESLLVEVFLSRSRLAQRVAEAWFLVPRPEPSIEVPDTDDFDELARELLRSHLREPWLDRDTFDLAASLLDRETKIALIRAMPAETAHDAYLALVARDVEVYHTLLERSDLARIQLTPFGNGGAVAVGPEFAARALRAGYSARQIADAIEPATGQVVSWGSNSSPDDLWRHEPEFPDSHQQLREAMEAWVSHTNADVRYVAELVVERYPD